MGCGHDVDGTPGSGRKGVALRYRTIDHTADFGLHIVGRDLKDLFETAAMAMVEQIVDRDGLPAAVRADLAVDGEDWPDLMVNWLREILYCWSGRQRVVKAVDIQRLEPWRILAAVGYDAFDPARHDIKKEIKAVTYHQIQAAPVGDRWEARVIFDV